MKNESYVKFQEAKELINKTRKMMEDLSLVKMDSFTNIQIKKK